jgi:hypothetical protein
MIVPVDISGRDDSTKILRPTATPAHRPKIMSASVASTASSLTFSHHGHAAAAVAAAGAAKGVEEIDEVELS